MPKIPSVVTIDLETERIRPIPDYPPKPAGVSIQFPGQKKPSYLAWGHPEKNNCSFANAKKELTRVWRSKDDALLFQNAKFDVDVIEKHFGLVIPKWDRIHDTMYLIFLSDPRADSLSLKPSAERILGVKPEEQNELHEWILAHVFTSEPGGEGDVRVQRGRPGGFYAIPPSKVGGFICHAPGDLVGRYANGDVDRTLKLFRKLYPEIVARGMLPAYDRERRLMPILLANEKIGMRVDVPVLSAAEKKYSEEIVKAETWLRKRLKHADLDFNKDVAVAEALRAAKVVTQFKPTKTGKDSVSKKNLLPSMFSCEKIASVLGYRNRLETCIGTFMQPWVRKALAGDGYLQTSWNQVRGSAYGTRTGRPSTNNPNYLNIPKSFDDKNDGYVHPAHINLATLPLMRKFILPDKGQTWGHRDYNQQELRLLGHFEDGELLSAYQENPTMDIHTYVQQRIKSLIGLSLERRIVKIVNFGTIYGMGIGKLAEQLGCSTEEAKRIKTAQLKAIPGLKDLSDRIKQGSSLKMPIVTWGGREYYEEEPVRDSATGRVFSFGYKLLNDLIQGSAADVTKEAIIRYDDTKKEGRFLVTVYDEINISAPKGAIKKEMKILREAMESVEVDVKMVSDGKTGPSWGELVKFKE